MEDVIDLPNRDVVDRIDHTEISEELLVEQFT